MSQEDDSDSIILSDSSTEDTREKRFSFDRAPRAEKQPERAKEYVASQPSKPPPKKHPKSAPAKNAARAGFKADPISKSQRKQNKKITKKHPEFELTYDMMLGIRTTVSRTEASVSKMRLFDQTDFMSSEKLRFPKRGSTYTPAHQMSDFKFKDYAPEIFKDLRTRFNIDPAEYLLRLCGDFEYLEFISNSKSGNFFFYTHDSQYMIKTQTKEEMHFLRRLLPAYYDYMSNNPNSLLTRFFGMHRVKPHKRNAVYFIVMGSVFYTDKFIHEVYDLKGSSLGREATEEEKSQNVPVLKDNDLINKKKKLRVGPFKAKTYLAQLERDCKFLAAMNIMDYSLLVGIHYKNRDSDGSKPKSPELQAKTQIDEFNVDFESLNIGSNSLHIPDEHEVKKFERGVQRNYGLRDGRMLTSPHQLNFEATTLDNSDLKVEVFQRQRTLSVSQFTDDDGGIMGVDIHGRPTNEMYFTGVIDILQQYNIKKRAETKLKTMTHDLQSISAVPPDVYAERLIEYLRDKIV